MSYTFALVVCHDAPDRPTEEIVCAFGSWCKPDTKTYLNTSTFRERFTSYFFVDLNNRSQMSKTFIF